MNRFAILLLVSSLGFAGCAHDHALERHDVVGMQNDSPAISVWSGPISNDAIARWQSWLGLQYAWPHLYRRPAALRIHSARTDPVESFRRRRTGRATGPGDRYPAAP